MIKFLFIMILLISGCSSLKFATKEVTCPKLSSPKGTEELVVKSDKENHIYVGLRGLSVSCRQSFNIKTMEVLVNVRAIRQNAEDDEEVPLNLSLVSVDKNLIEIDRDDFSYNQFLKKNNKIVDRTTSMKIRYINADDMTVIGIIKK